jgi:hypothetical protein
MRLIGVASIVFTVALTFVMSGFGPAATAQQLAGQSGDDDERIHRNGQAIFRFDSFCAASTTFADRVASTANVTSVYVVVRGVLKSQRRSAVRRRGAIRDLGTLIVKGNVIG